MYLLEDNLKTHHFIYSHAIGFSCIINGRVWDMKSINSNIDYYELLFLCMESKPDKTPTQLIRGQNGHLLFRFIKYYQINIYIYI